MLVLVIDTETTGIDPSKNKTIEMAAALVDLKTKTILKSYSCLMPSETNEAEKFNGISAEMLSSPAIKTVDLKPFLDMAKESGCFVAHNAQFDRSFLTRAFKDHHPEALLASSEFKIGQVPWFCSYQNINHSDVFNTKISSRKLTHIAVDIGLVPTKAHRALADVLTLVDILLKIPDVNDIVEKFVSSVPPIKPLYKAHFDFHDKEIPKSHGFRWEPLDKSWRKEMSDDEVAALPFKVELVDG